MNSTPKTSWPAVTGVWVVNTHWDFTFFLASSSGVPLASSSRRSSSVRNAEWPSFMWKTRGFKPRARSARTPPKPSVSSWTSRVSWLPP